jgi:hypothetical protein
MDRNQPVEVAQHSPMQILIRSRPTPVTAIEIFAPEDVPEKERGVPFTGKPSVRHFYRHSVNITPPSRESTP